MPGLALLLLAAGSLFFCKIQNGLPVRFETEEGGILNTEQLRRLKAVVFNNSTGRVLNDEHQHTLGQYVGVPD